MKRIEGSLLILHFVLYKGCSLGLETVLRSANVSLSSYPQDQFSAELCFPKFVAINGSKLVRLCDVTCRVKTLYACSC